MKRDIFLPLSKILFKGRQIPPNDEITLHDAGTYFSHPELRWHHAETNFSRCSKFGSVITRTLFSYYGFHLGCTEGQISPISKILVQRVTKCSKWRNRKMWWWNIFLPSWNELISCWDKFLQFFKIWLHPQGVIVLLLWLSPVIYRGTYFSCLKKSWFKQGKISPYENMTICDVGTYFSHHEMG